MSDSKLEGALETNDSATPYAEHASRVAKGAGIVYAGSTIGGGLRYLFQVIVARHLGVELFGLFSLGFAVFNVAAEIACLGMRRGVVRYVSFYQGEGDQRRTKGTINLATALSVGGGIVVSVLLIALSKVLAIDVFHAAELTNVLRIFAIAVPFSALTTVLLSAVQALGIIKYNVYVRDLFEQLSRITLVGLVFLLGWQLWGVVFAVVVSIAGGTVLSVLFYRKVFRPVMVDRVLPVFEPGRLLAFCWPLLLVSCLYPLDTWITTLVLGYFAAPEAVGIFGVAYRTSLLVQGILMSFNVVFAPIISDLYHRREIEELRGLFKLVARWVFSLSFPVALLMIVFSQEIMTIVGRDFAAGATSLTVLSIGQIAGSASGSLGLMIDMSGKTKITLLNAILHLLLQAGLCFLLIPRHGIVGAAWAKTISVGFRRVIQLVQVHFILRMHPFEVKFLKPLIAGGASWLVLSLAKMYILETGNSVLLFLLGSSVFLGIYGLTLYRLGVDEQDRVIIQRIRAKFA